MTTLSSQNNQLKATAKQKQADDFQAKTQKADLELKAAEVLRDKAAAAASGDEAAQRSFELKQERALTDAQIALTKAGGDWSKLTVDQKVAMQPQVQKDIDGYRTELNDPVLKEQLNDIEHPDVQKAAQDRAAELHTQLDDARKHSIYVSPTAASDKVAHPEVQSALLTIPGFNPRTASVIANMDPASLPQYVAAAPISQEQKDAIYKALKIQPPAAAQTPQPWGQHSTPAQDVQRAIQNAPAPTPETAAATL